MASGWGSVHIGPQPVTPSLQRSRLFVRANGDYLTTGAGGLASLDGGPNTVAWIWKPASVHAGGIVRANNASNGKVFGVNPFSDGNVYYGAGGYSVVGGYTASDGWTMHAVTKGDGTGIARSHKYPYATATWTHTNHGNVGDSTTGPAALVTIGQEYNSEKLDGHLAVLAVWGRALSDAELEGLTASLSAWKAESPAALWPFNQGNVADGVVDATGNGADQTFVSGTAVSTDLPAGFVFD